ncbi:nicotinamide mononucleotide transporter [Flagellimonas hymeniacidonis]|uniref:Nicotinamide riboside transporter PnuC n=1 Tax=Flagellimonas hymeniacidonis TaxID=2603628 RepID=A0A5C8V9D0_9FLAO|nr:nicotinamide riboside transporter PnuC [Flagellimonas hymeniacidonis]TXN38026.1 nicotinamide mononucleotide transporter [Flagellimonas hymeniacidonis]
MNHIFDFFLDTYRNKETYVIALEAIVFITGILSVWYAKQENILVYPSGLIATIIAVYLLFKDDLYGDMMMNFYFSIMSVYGWWNWARKKDNEKVVKISRTNSNEKLIGFGLFLLTMIITYAVYKTSGIQIETSNYIDIFTSGLFFTGMWYMAKKKIENWTLWIIADIITVPLYAYRGWGMLSLQYLIFTVLAIQAYFLWKKSLGKSPQPLLK